MIALGTVAQLWRYPVKSFAGERLERAEIAGGKVVGDRDWGVFDRRTGHLGSAKRVAALLGARARWHDGTTEVELPTGYRGVAGDAATDAAVSAWLGFPAELRRARAGVVSTIDMDVVDADGRDAGVASFDTRPGRLFDSGSPLHAVVAATLAQLDREHAPGAGDARRYRPTMVIDGTPALAELAWVGTRVRLGALPAVVRKRAERCVLVTRAQPDAGLVEDRRILRTLRDRHQVCVGVYLDLDDGVTGALALGTPITGS